MTASPTDITTRQCFVLKLIPVMPFLCDLIIYHPSMGLGWTTSGRRELCRMEPSSARQTCRWNRNRRLYHGTCVKAMYGLSTRVSRFGDTVGIGRFVFNMPCRMCSLILLINMFTCQRRVCHVSTRRIQWNSRLANKNRWLTLQTPNQDIYPPRNHLDHHSWYETSWQWLGPYRAHNALVSTNSTDSLINREEENEGSFTFYYWSCDLQQCLQIRVSTWHSQIFACIYPYLGMALGVYEIKQI